MHPALLFIFFDGPEVWTQRLVFARQMLYHLNHTPSLALFYFLDRVSCFCLVLASDCDPPTSAS
jgi:hypothetical protein